MIEAALDVALDDPLIRRPLTSAVPGLGLRSHGHADVLQGAMAAASGPEPVGDMPEVRLEDRLHKILDRALDNAIAHGRDTQGAELPWLARLRDELPARWARLIPARPQVVSEAFEERRFSR